MQAQECAFAPGAWFFTFRGVAPQTKTSLRLSRPYAGKAVCLLSVLILNKKTKHKRLVFLLNMRRKGLEPLSLAACAPQTHAYTNSATCAKIFYNEGMSITTFLF